MQIRIVQYKLYAGEGCDDPGCDGPGDGACGGH